MTKTETFEEAIERRKQENREESERYTIYSDIMERVLVNFSKSDLPKDVRILMAREHLEDLCRMWEEQKYDSEFNIRLIDILLEGTEAFDEWKEHKKTPLKEGGGKLYKFRESLNDKIDLEKTQEYADSL